MKKSIRWELSITFAIVMLCLIVSIILFNTLFLEKLYLNNKRSVIKKSYVALDKGIADAYALGYDLTDLFNRKRDPSGVAHESNLALFLRELQEVYGVSAVLMDSNNKTFSLFQSSSRFDRRMMEYIFRENANDEILKVLEKNDSYTIAISNNPKVNSALECFGFLSDNQTAFLLTIPIESIKEPIDLFNKVLIIVSLVALLIGAAAILFLSNRITEPLLELANISRKMSRLEFENKYRGDYQNEIGILGNSMNEMSDRLEKSIKELKNANYKLKKDLEKKEELDLMRQEFVANVSHELKTPIALIKGYAEGLEMPEIASKEEKRDYYVSVIKDETDKMDNMVRQLLSLSELERGMEELDITRINLKVMVTGVTNAFEIRLNTSNIKPIINIDNGTYVWTDGYKLEEVIKNYLSNAINHVDENKTIVLETKNVTDSIIRFSVFNSGVQLSEEEMKKIWDKFYKVDKAHTRSYGGTGLGLSIVKAIAKELNTNCGCDNEIKNNVKGMEFYFDFATK